jgi:Fis family transcriptional regulator
MTTPNLPDCVRANLEAYFADLGDTEPANLHDMVLRAVEAPLLAIVMQRARGNQSRAAQWLGLNRNTLRKKLREHGLLADDPS